MQVYNTYNRRKEEFIPRDPGKAAIYVCGPTTYNFIHLGNARPLVVFDTIRRYLVYRGYQVRYVLNFTDIDDKIINRSREEGEDPMTLSRRYISEFYQDAGSLNVMEADVHPRVSGHIPEIINMVSTLVEKDHAYVQDGDVYFDISSFPGYGRLSGRSVDEMLAGARVEVDERKKHPMDFALWKSARPGEPSWDSPWGQGRPGWHIECSAMSLKYLGESFDIHGGGFDLIFPHHENEIAQSEAATGKPFVRYWMHNGFITVNQEKMSKSLGNFFLVRDILKKFSPDVVRFYLLSTHYRSPLDFDDEKLEVAGRGLERIKTSIRLQREAAAGTVRHDTGDDDAGIIEQAALRREEFEKAMDDDFNTALAIGTFFEAVGDVNAYLRRVRATGPSVRALEEVERLFKDFNMVLGLFPAGAGGEIILDGDGGSDELFGKLMDLVIGIRLEARKKKDWATADRIRDGLKEIGIVLEDTTQGTRWKYGL